MKFTELIPALNTTIKLLRSFKRLTGPAPMSGSVLVRVERGEAIFVRREAKK